MERRALLRGLAVVLAGLSGCVGVESSGREAPDTVASTDTPTARPPDAGGSYGSTAGPTDEDGIVDDTDRANPDHPIRVSNRDDAAHHLEIQVRQNGTLVDTVTHNVSAGSDAVVYNLRDAEPDGIEPYSITATVGNQTESVSVRTDDCFGEVNVNIRSDGELSVGFEIC